MREYKNTKTLLKHIEFNRVFKYGKYYSGKYIYAFIMPNKENLIRIGFVVSKKNGKAVQRNKAKRKLRSAFFRKIDELKNGYSIVIGLKKNVIAKDLKYTDVQKDMNQILKSVVK